MFFSCSWRKGHVTGTDDRYCQRSWEQTCLISSSVCVSCFLRNPVALHLLNSSASLSSVTSWPIRPCCLIACSDIIKWLLLLPHSSRRACRSKWLNEKRALSLPWQMYQKHNLHIIKYLALALCKCHTYCSAHKRTGIEIRVWCGTWIICSKRVLYHAWFKKQNRKLGCDVL